MSKIFYLMGKSSSGKDTIFNELIKKQELNLKTIVGYTTRPIREGEANGKEYYFVDESKMNDLDVQGKIIEKRTYHTVHGEWHYFTVDDGQIDITKNDYLLIGTLESFRKIRKYFGNDIVVPIYIEVDDGLRLERALSREKKQNEPKYSEMCRRFLADQKDFSEKNIIDSGIKKRYNNNDISECLREIVQCVIIPSKD
jgi:guanylate kinase